MNDVNIDKPFKTIDEQIEILKSRNLIIDDEEDAKNFLLWNNYYNVVNIYGKFFVESGKDTFIQGTNFREIQELYYLDREIKNLFFKTIITLEKSFKSILAYTSSKNHNSRYAYLDIYNFNNKNQQDCLSVISSITKTINSNKDEECIKHYIENHNHIPLWVIINYQDFGSTIRFYKAMNEKDRNEIAKIYSISLQKSLHNKNVKLKANEIEKILFNIKKIRNITAHNNKLLSYTCRENIPFMSYLHSLYGIEPSQPKQDVYNVFIAMRALLTENAYTIFNNSLRKKMNKSKNKFKTVSFNKIINSLGFPDNWYEIEKIN